LQGRLPRVRAQGRRPEAGAGHHREREDVTAGRVQRSGVSARRFGGGGGVPARRGARARRGGGRAAGWRAGAGAAGGGRGGGGGEVPVKPAASDDWGREFLDLILAVRVVDDLDQALEHIATYGSEHTEAIVTKSKTVAARFEREVCASAVMWNASTRFNDGG